METTANDLVIDNVNYTYLEQICKEVVATIHKKNHDYGNAFEESAKMFRDYPQSKIYEKVKRIITLSKEDAHVSNEGLEDALKDSIGYCLLYLNLLNNKK